MFCTIKFVYYKSFCVRDDIGSYIRTVYHMVSHTPKKALNASLCVADLIGMGFKTYRVADKPLPKPSAEGTWLPRDEKEHEYDFIITFLIKIELKQSRKNYVEIV